MFRAIHDQIELVVNLEKALEMIERLPSQNRKAFNYEAQIAKLEEEIERYQKLKLRLYEDLSDGIIDKSNTLSSATATPRSSRKNRKPFSA